MSEKLTTSEIRQVCVEVFADGGAEFDRWLEGVKLMASARAIVPPVNQGSFAVRCGQFSHEYASFKSEAIDTIGGRRRGVAGSVCVHCGGVKYE